MKDIIVVDKSPECKPIDYDEIKPYDPLNIVVNTLNAKKNFDNHCVHNVKKVLEEENFVYGCNIDLTSNNSEIKNENIEQLQKEILRTIDAVVVTKKNYDWKGEYTGNVTRIKLIRDDYEVEDLPILKNDGINKLFSYTRLFNNPFGDFKLLYGNKLDNAVLYSNVGLSYNEKLPTITLEYPLIQDHNTAELVMQRELTKRNTISEITIGVPHDQFNLNVGDCFVLDWEEGESVSDFNVKKVFRIKHKNVYRKSETYTYKAIEEPYQNKIKGE